MKKLQYNPNFTNNRMFSLHSIKHTNYYNRTHYIKKIFVTTIYISIQKVAKRLDCDYLLRETTFQPFRHLLIELGNKGVDARYL
jgi:hypothetical protein